MSDQLKDALRFIKGAVDGGGSVLYLHDPDDGKPFAVALRVGGWGDRAASNQADRRVNVALDALEAEGWNPYDHNHVEGTEDED